jgi:cation diffusion facilitator CzcD-associated flavoprotein CzcO
MGQIDRSDRYCIIGGGAAGLAAARHFAANELGFDLIEKEDDFGGVWNYGKPCSALYRSVHMISSKGFSEYPDYPAPEEWPIYLRSDQALDYLRSYARHFDLYKSTEFGREVVEIRPQEDSDRWIVRLDGGDERVYRGVVVANGHHTKPRLPDAPGHFSGLQLHSGQYKTPECLSGKRVLVVGAGNSGCDLAVEAVHHAAKVFHSTRRGYFYWPKFIWGMPADEWAHWFMVLRTPLWARRFFGRYFLKWASAGSPEDYGMPKPDHKMFESHFIVNSTLMYHLGHGDIAPKPDVKELQEDKVVFADGSVEDIDVILWATGFHLSFPFIDQKYLRWEKSQPDMFMNVFDRAHPNLFFIGLFQISTGNWPIMDGQSRLLARYLVARETQPKRVGFLQKLIAHAKTDATGGVRYQDVSRHAVEFEYFVYQKKLERLIRKLPGKRAPAPDKIPRPTTLPIGAAEEARAQ